MIEVTGRVKCSGLSYVESLRHGNDDRAVEDAARVSHDGCAEDASPGLIRYLAENDHFTPFGHARFSMNVPVIYEDDTLDWLAGRLPGWSISPTTGQRATKMLRVEGSLYNWLGKPEDLPFSTTRSPFYDEMLLYLIDSGCKRSVSAFLSEGEIAGIGSMTRRHDYELEIGPGTWKTFRIKAPVFVLRQLMRSSHEIVYNEVSRRYVKSDPEFFNPEVWRKAPAKSIKQGSGEGEVRAFSKDSISRWISERGFFPFAVDLATAHNDWIQTASELYRLYLEAGVAPELARVLLPVSHYSEVWATMSPAAIGRVVGLRSNRGEKNHAQREVEEISRAIESLSEIA
jgi:hypothetical protein